MSARSSLPSLLESFFRHRMMKQRNASEATIASYRDGLRLLILFAAEHTQRKPCALTVADLDRDLVLAFLDDLETKRQNRWVVLRIHHTSSYRLAPIMVEMVRCQCPSYCAPRSSLRSEPESS
jgi:site-specific recombinase XerD